MLQTILLVVGALALVALAPVILRFTIPLVIICAGLLFIFGTGGWGIIPLIVLGVCILVNKVKGGGE